MKRPCVLAACLVSAFVRPAAADILRVIPQSALVVVVTRNADMAEKNFRAVAGKISGKTPKDDLVEALLRGFADVDASVKGQLAAATVNRTAPMALVMMAPKADAAGVPGAIVLKVTNYRTFLEKLAELTGTAV
ncbi:unnamed protein product, partial [marine sediment metagenome]